MSPVDVVPNPWLRGVLEPCLLSLLATEEAYGYQLATELERRGIGKVAGGTLYPALLRLEEQGLVVADWRQGDGGPGRKYYRATTRGRRELQATRARWQDFATAVGGLLGAEALR